MVIPRSFLHIDELEKVTLEFTTRCNLRCVYCAVSYPWHKKEDLDIENFDEFIGELRRLKVKKVQISGGGETTIVKGWESILDRLIDAGIQVCIITNLGKPLGRSAIRSLSRCVELSTSCDTVDAELFARIRRGALLPDFFSNIARIRAQAALEERPGPYLIWNQVATDRTIQHADEWVAMGLALGIDHFQISELMKSDDLPDTIQLQSVAHLSDEALAAARASVEKARRLAEQAGKWFAVLPGVEAALAGGRIETRIQATVSIDETGKSHLDQAVTVKQEVGTPEGGPVLDAAQPPSSKTRRCLMPWKEAYLYSSNQAGPCCMYRDEEQIHPSGLGAAINSPNFVQMREGLLTGHLRYPCTICTMFPETSVSELITLVAEHLTPKGVAVQRPA